jgi:exportin-2 (importin alpha re-exporter)
MRSKSPALPLLSFELTNLASDEELFEDDPLDYIRRDLEGSDSDTRRRSASDFVRGLMDYFERSVTVIVNDYITHYLADYASNPQNNWRSKDTALFLFSAIAIKSNTAKGGVTSTNLLVDVVQFWTGNALEEFSKRAAHPVLQADYIRYIYVFRNQLTREQLRTIMPYLVAYLATEDYVVYTYAAVTLDRLLLLKREDGPVFTKTDLGPVLQELLGSMFQRIEVDPRPEKLAENDFLMKCSLPDVWVLMIGMMRVMVTSREALEPFMQVSTQHLIGILGEISKNPSNPRFNHYLFECLAALIRYSQSLFMG